MPTPTPTPTPAPRVVEVALAGGRRGDALVRALADRRRLVRDSRLSLALGLRCPGCGRAIVAAVADDWTAAALAAALRAGGRCRHEAPPSPAA